MTLDCLRVHRSRRVRGYGGLLLSREGLGPRDSCVRCICLLRMGCGALMIVMAADPGLRGCGVAVFDDARLIWAGYARSAERTVRGPAAWQAAALAVVECYPLGLDVLVVEYPQIYRGMYAADLVEITGVVGAVVGQYEGRCQEVVGYLPRDWTMGVPKEVRHARLEKDLSEEEWAAIEDAGALTHNVLDAVGIGLFYLKGKRT